MQYACLSAGVVCRAYPAPILGHYVLRSSTLHPAWGKKYSSVFGSFYYWRGYAVIVKKGEEEGEVRFPPATSSRGSGDISGHIFLGLYKVVFRWGPACPGSESGYSCELPGSLYLYRINDGQRGGKACG
ncbi:hypothetical protein B0T21DRAFT_390014 [Apiosordaria backusii]|uniref:Uncharacterized protein n=1 Tax=Apiosordaria backusii TaxID=314023 RepID=A0AA40ESN4_9PEZI|nr:hypothetical protein B0T21DRAFT_390014 [Apiosordaria backusii]